MTTSARQPAGKRRTHEPEPSSTAGGDLGATAEKRGRPGRLVWIAAAALLVALTLQLALSARHKSATMDEQNHIARGLAYLRTGDVRLNREHPPLIEAVCALPLLTDARVVLPIDDQSWRVGSSYVFADQFLWKSNSNGPSIVSRARVPIMVLTLLLGLTVYAWSSELSGSAAGLLSLFLLTFDPAILSHGSLATNDLGLALFSTLCAYSFWRFLRRPGWLRSGVAGLTLGLALVSKFSAVFLLAALAAIAVIDRFRARSASDAPRLLLMRYLVIIVAAGTTVWAIYGFRVGPVGFGGFAVPAPGYLEGLSGIVERVEGGNPAFLLGAYSETGWWYYFPAAFLFKTPLPTIAATLAALVLVFYRRTILEAAPVLIPAALYASISLTSSLNIGYRHLLPVLPLLFVFAGQAVKLVSRTKRRWQAAALIPIVWLVVGTLRIAPDYLAYFNELAGGPSNGYKVLVDSNLDWGQDLIQLREFMSRNQIESVKLSYFGSAPPEAYGIEYEPLPGYPFGRPFRPSELEQIKNNPPPGVYAISVTNLQGVFFPDRDLYAWFRGRTPDAAIGYSIFVYRVPEGG